MSDDHCDPAPPNDKGKASLGSEEPKAGKRTDEGDNSTTNASFTPAKSDVTPLKTGNAIEDLHGTVFSSRSASGGQREIEQFPETSSTGGNAGNRNLENVISDIVPSGSNSNIGDKRAEFPFKGEKLEPTDNNVEFNSPSKKIGADQSNHWLRKLFKGSRPTAKATTSKIEINENDVVIAVMGRVGREEKRSFIDNAVGDGIRREDTASLHTHFVVARHPRNSSQSIFFVYTTGSRDQKMNEAIRYVLRWISDVFTLKRKFSGFIYLEDTSTLPPTKLTNNALDLLGQCVESQNIVIATTGWDDSNLNDKHKLEDRHTQLIRQWRPFVDRGVSVLRLAAPGKFSRDVFHDPLDIVNLVTTKIDGKGPTIKRRMYRGMDYKAEDKFLEDPRDTDIVVPVMGPSGVGKSTFINYVYGGEIVKVGRSLESQTVDLQPVMLINPTDHTRRIVLVDTPGFDDSNEDDSEILRRIAVWLARSYSANMTLAGVIYLHEINQTRVFGTVEKNLEMFSKMIGQDATKNVSIVTTKWRHVPKDVGIDREKQLRERHWNNMLNIGARLFRFEDSQESGERIIRSVIEHVEKVQADIEIQKELVEIRKILPNTEAGQALLFSLEEYLEYQRQNAAALNEEEDNDDVRAERKEIEQKIRETLQQINKLSGHPLLNLWRKLTQK